MNAAKENAMSFQVGQKAFYNDVPCTVTEVHDLSVTVEFKSGNLINMGLESATEYVTASPRVPKVGEGATHYGYSDRSAWTVIKVSKSGKTVDVQRDIATRTDNNGMSECQTYTFTPNPQGGIQTIRLGKRGWRAKDGSKFSVGGRSEYYDYSF